MADEKEALRRIIVDAIDYALRYNRDRNGNLDPYDVAQQIARDVMQQLARQNIQITSST